MSRALVSSTLLAGSILAQECTLDTLAKCASADLIAPTCSTGITGQWVCSPEGRCIFKCETTVSDTALLCPDGKTKVIEAFGACVGIFNSQDCSCTKREEPTCTDGTLVTTAAHDCYAQGGVLADLQSCKCNIVTTEPVIVCDTLAKESCAKIGGTLGAAPKCECLRNYFCPDGSSQVEAAEKCRSANLLMKPDTCECIEPVTTTTDVEKCKFTLNDGTVAYVDVFAAAKECAARGDDYRFATEASTMTCKCQRFALTADALCPSPYDAVTVEYARKKCEGMFAYPRTATFMPDTCKCEPIPVDLVEKVDCTYFTTCSQDVPCLSREKGACLAASAAGDCPTGTLQCQAFGITGQVCPSGLPYDKAKQMCVEKGAPEKARFYPDTCECEPIVLTTACGAADISTYDTKLKECIATGGLWMADSCTCKAPAQVTCATNTIDYARAKEACLADATKFFVESPYCACITKTDRPVTEGCSSFTSIEEALRFCKGALTSPATQVFDKATCQCSDIVPTKPPVPLEPFKANIILKICRDGITAEEVKMALVKIMNSVQAMLALSFPEARIIFNSLALDNGCVAISITVIHPDKTILAAILEKARTLYAANVQLQDAIRFSLETSGNDPDDKVPVALALEVVGEISGGAPAFNTLDVNSAPVAAPAMAFLGALIGLFM